MDKQFIIGEIHRTLLTRLLVNGPLL